LSRCVITQITLSMAFLMNKPYLDSVSCIAFDFCGTLADLQPSSLEILEGWLHTRFGLHFEPERLSFALKRAGAESPYSSLSVRNESERRRYFVDFNSRVLHLLGFDGDDGEQLYAEFMEHDRHWLLKPGTESLLKELRTRGYRIVLASNFDSTLMQLLSRNGTAELFDELFVSAELHVEKPDTAFYRHIQESLGCPASDIVMIGDDLLLDVYPALEVGLKSIHLRMDGDDHFAGRFIPAPGYLEISRLDDLLLVCPELTKSALLDSDAIQQLDDGAR